MASEVLPADVDSDATVPAVLLVVEPAIVVLAIPLPLEVVDLIAAAAGFGTAGLNANRSFCATDALRASTSASACLVVLVASAPCVPARGRAASRAEVLDGGSVD